MKVWKYGDDINTDMLFPGKYTYTCATAEEVKPHRSRFRVRGRGVGR